MKCSYLDLISPKITLFYKNSLVHTSLCSIILSFIYVILLIIFTIIISLDFILHKNPTTIFFRRYVENAGFFPLNSSSIFHFISFGLNNYNEKAFSIIGVNHKREDLIKISNETLFDHWIYGLCEENNINDKIIYISDLDNYYNNCFCIKQFYDSSNKKIYNINEEGFKNSFLQYGASNPNEIFYGLYIKRCQNNTIFNNNTCYNNSIIDDLLISSFNYSIYFLDQNINIENYHNPLNNFFHKINNDFNLVSYTLNVLNFHPLIIESYTGIIFDKKKVINTYVYESNEKLVYDKSENDFDIFGSFYFSMQNMEDVYERKYKLLQDITGSIAGISRIISIIITIINYYFSQFSIYNDLINDINSKYIDLGEKLKSSKTLKMNLFMKNKDEENISNSFHHLKQNNFIQSNNKIHNEDFNNYLKEINIINKKKTQKNNINNSIDNTFFNFNRININHKNNHSFCYFICNLFSFKKKKNKIFIKKTLKFRIKTISEESIFSIYYFIESFKKLIYTNDNKFNKENQ